jgi:hypothetical protein
MWHTVQKGDSMALVVFAPDGVTDVALIENSTNAPDVALLQHAHRVMPDALACAREMLQWYAMADELSLWLSQQNDARGTE